MCLIILVIFFNRKTAQDLKYNYFFFFCIEFFDMRKKILALLLRLHPNLHRLMLQCAPGTVIGKIHEVTGIDLNKVRDSNLQETVLRMNRDQQLNHSTSDIM